MSVDIETMGAFGLTLLGSLEARERHTLNSDQCNLIDLIRGVEGFAKLPTGPGSDELIARGLLAEASTIMVQAVRDEVARRMRLSRRS